MESKRKRILSAVVLVILIVGWYVTIFGIGSFKSISEQMKYGLDINGGVYVVMQADTDETGTDLTQLMDQTKTVLENRVNAMGISEATVAVEGSDKIRVEMPGVEDADEAIEQIGQTAQLKFLLADGTFVMDGSSVKDAGFTTDSDHGGYKITIDFTSEGSDAFAEATEKAAEGNIVSTITDDSGEKVANDAVVIMLDDQIVSAPGVSQKIVSSSCEIYRSGGFSEDEASSVSNLIKGGALPTSLEEVNSSTQTATIGADSLSKSVKAGIIGLLIIFVIMLMVYGSLGVVADIGLALYVLIVLWSMAAMGAVLTLPGIAGIILSIGMAVDSNVIIFTRIREEIAKGKSIRVSVDTGFHAALSTVIDSQTTTLIAAIVLYLIGTTTVKGFALTLMIGTILSIITAVFITQLFVTMMAESKTFSKLKYFGMNEDHTHKHIIKKYFHFVENRKKFYAFSLTVILIGAIFVGVKGFNYGIDFTGGTMIQMDMGTEVKTADLEKTIEQYDLNPTIVYSGDDNEQVIIKTIKSLDAEKRTEVVNTIEDKYGLEDDSVLASEEFGPTVGKELRTNAIKSILIAGLCMLIYIRFRFKTWKYGLAAVSGLVHDVLFTLAIYAIFGFSINNPFIAGILTVVGYSINDTIVVFDRIRENSVLYRKRDVSTLINDSINQTLSRSIMTSATTLLVMLPLFIFVSAEIREFLIPLLIGVSVGTYSSIFICSPVYYESMKKVGVSKYKEKQKKLDKSKAKEKRNAGIQK